MAPEIYFRGQGGVSSKNYTVAALKLMYFKCVVDKWNVNFFDSRIFLIRKCLWHDGSRLLMYTEFNQRLHQSKVEHQTNGNSVFLCNQALVQIDFIHVKISMHIDCNQTLVVPEVDPDAEFTQM